MPTIPGVDSGVLITFYGAEVELVSIAAFQEERARKSFIWCIRWAMDEDLSVSCLDIPDKYGLGFVKLKHKAVVCVWDHVGWDKWSVKDIIATSYCCVDSKWLELLHWAQLKNYGLQPTTDHEAVIRVFNEWPYVLVSFSEDWVGEV